MRYKITRPRSGFTLVELLVVIAIIGILVALLLPAVQAAREAARRAQCTNNLKNLTLAILNHEAATKHLPPGRYGCDGGNCSPRSVWSRGASGFLVILPYLEEQALYDSIDFSNGPWRTPNNTPERNAATPHGTNTTLVATRLQTMECPSDTKEPFATFKPQVEAVGSYAFCSGTLGPSNGIFNPTKYSVDGAFQYLQGTERLGFELREFTDGTSSTIFLGEARDGHLQPTRNRWTAAGRHVDSLRTTDNPMNSEIETGWSEVDQYGYKTVGSFASRHPGGVQFAFGDGHVELLNESMSLLLYQALSTRAEGDGVVDE